MYKILNMANTKMLSKDIQIIFKSDGNSNKQFEKICAEDDIKSIIFNVEKRGLKFSWAPAFHATCKSNAHKACVYLARKIRDTIDPMSVYHIWQKGLEIACEENNLDVAKIVVHFRSSAITSADVDDLKGLEKCMCLTIKLSILQELIKKVDKRVVKRINWVNVLNESIKRDSDMDKIEFIFSSFFSDLLGKSISIPMDIDWKGINDLFAKKGRVEFYKKIENYIKKIAFNRTHFWAKNLKLAIENENYEMILFILKNYKINENALSDCIKWGYEINRFDIVTAAINKF